MEFIVNQALGRAVSSYNSTMPQTDYLRNEHHEFLDASRAALANEGLQKILIQLGDSLGKKNRDAWAALPNSDAVRERARAIKDATLAELDQHLATLADSVQRLGGHVHWAETGDDACRAIIDIVDAAGRRRSSKASR